MQSPIAAEVSSSTYSDTLYRLGRIVIKYIKGCLTFLNTYKFVYHNTYFFALAPSSSLSQWYIGALLK